MKISTICFPVRNGKVILANKKIDFGEGLLNGYGGKFKPEDVTVEVTAVRELFEEGKVVALPNKLERVAIIDFFRADTQIFECHVFFCHEWSGELIETDEMGPPMLFDVNNLPFDRMWGADKVWLPLVFSGKIIRAICRYNPEMKNVIEFKYEQL